MTQTTPPIETLLARLDGVRANPHERQWAARCPAHKDRSPSLSIRELDDGSLLIHCHAGCGTEAILDAIGLEFADLYPPRPEHRRPTRYALTKTELQQIADILALETEVIRLYARDAAAGKIIPETDRQRFQTAKDRVDHVQQTLRQR
jgi:hypothetical protein